MFTTEPLDGPFGIEITAGVDVLQPLTPEQVGEIDRLMDEHAVVLIRNLPMSMDEQLTWTRQFGPLDQGFKKVIAKDTPPSKMDEVGDISNLNADGSVAKRSDKQILNNMANQLWHSDSSFQMPAAKYSMLHSVRNPSWGAETEFADMRAAYDGLPQRMKDLLEDKVAKHFALHSRFLLGDDNYSDAQVAAIDPTYWPIVRSNPRTGRRHLFTGVHACAINGMTMPEARVLLLDILEHATQPQFRYSHDWLVGDTLIWDNRSTLHRGRAYDLDEPRELRRTTTLDDQAPELAAA